MDNICFAFVSQAVSSGQLTVVSHAPSSRQLIEFSRYAVELGAVGVGAILNITPNLSSRQVIEVV